MTDPTTAGWALVTGASKGIGAATAEALAAAGHDVLVGYGGDATGAQAVVERCTAHGVQARAVAADLSRGVEALLAAAGDVGGVTALVNNAGVAVDGLALTLSDEAFLRSLDVNLAAAFRLSRGVLRGMLKARHGRIVNVSSVVGLHGNAGQTAYAAAKAGLVGMTKALAREVGKRGITVNAVAPGFIATAMTQDLSAEDFKDRIPAGRLGTPEEVAAVIAFLCSAPAAYVNGAVVVVDGGLFGVTTAEVSRLEASPAAMRAVHALLGPLTLRRLRVEVTGREHVPGAGGVLLAANHRSFLDHFVLSAAAPRPPRFLGKVELSQGLHGRFNLAFGMLPVTRGTADQSALVCVVDRLKAGDCVAMFPEGTRSPTGELFRFRSGLARIAADAEVPVVPVGLIGLATVWPRGENPRWKERPAPGLLQVHFGQPVVAADTSPRARRELTQAVYEQILDLCGQPAGSGFAPINPFSGTGSS